METKSTIASLPSPARAWIAVGFAVVAIAAVVSNADAVTGGAEPSAAGPVIMLPAPPDSLSGPLEGAQLPLSAVTPAETVAAYDR